MAMSGNNDSNDIFNMVINEQEIDKINDNNDSDDILNMDDLQKEIDNIVINDNNDSDIDDIDDLDDVDDLEDLDDMDDVGYLDDMEDMNFIIVSLYLDLDNPSGRSTRPATGGVVKNKRRMRAIQQKFYEQRMKILSQKKSQVFGNTSICYIISSFLDVETRINARSAKLLI